LASNFAAREEALALADQGDLRGAASVLRSQAETNAALPAPVRAGKLEKEAESLGRVADDLDTGEKFNKRTRKEFQYESYKQKKQKN
jgi:hypothetical protein